MLYKKSNKLSLNKRENKLKNFVLTSMGSYGITGIQIGSKIIKVPKNKIKKDL